MVNSLMPHSDNDLCHLHGFCAAKIVIIFGFLLFLQWKFKFYMALPERKNIRAAFHDYSGGDYFVTICTANKEHYFGRIVGTHGSCVRSYEMHFSQIGRFCHNELSSIQQHYPYAEIPLFVVMPNHIHAIICIHNKCFDLADVCGHNLTTARTHGPCVPTVRSALSVVVGGFKRSVTMYARRNSIKFGWQGRFHDHIIRGVKDGNMIAEYIHTNVAKWDSDCFNC